MSRFRLQLNDGYEFIAIGISYHFKDYKLAWKLNKAFKLVLKRHSISIAKKNAQPLDYALFKYRDEKNHLQFILLNNKSEGVPMIKSYKQFDFVLLVEGFIDLFDNTEFMAKMQTLEGIQLITPLSTQHIERYQYELFEDPIKPKIDAEKQN